MLFGQNRDELRRFYCQTWRDHRDGRPLEPIQTQIISVIQQHPEYHALLEKPDAAIGRDYLPELGETNPFLHMGLHLAIQEQVDTDRPHGIRDLYAKLQLRFGDPHELEHRIMECLAEMIWQSQKSGEAPDEEQYLACIRSVAEDG